MKSYAMFEVWVDQPAAAPAAGAPLVCPVQVFDSPAGPARGEMTLDLQDAGLTAGLAIARSDGPDLDGRKALGALLYQALFNGKVRDAWMTSLGRVEQDHAADGLRLCLWINAPQVAALPWELLWDDQRGFLATAADLAVCRYLPVPEPPFLPAQERLSILMVVESPQNLEPVEPQEVSRIEAALQSLGDLAEYKVVRNLSMPQLQSELQQKDYHVLHFLGHGTPGKLALVQEDSQQALFIGDQELAQLFLGRRSLRLVVMTACASSQAGEGGLFSGIGPALVQKRLPAVVAMQYPAVHQDTASRFSQAFYGALANGLPVDVAVNQGRQLLSAGALLDGRDWSTPVLYLGTRSGRVLSFARDQADTVGRAWQTVQATAQQSATAQAALAELAQRFREAAARHRQLGELVAISGYLKAMHAAFDPWQEPAAAARWDSPRLLPRFALLQQSWPSVGQGLADLEVYLQNHPGLAAVWFPLLKQRMEAVAGHVSNGALGPLPEAILAFGGQLAQAETQVSGQLQQAITELLAFSERTLGRLAIDE